MFFKTNGVRMMFSLEISHTYEDLLCLKYARNQSVGICQIESKQGLPLYEMQSFKVS
jgi:hypothetical protein